MLLKKFIYKFHLPCREATLLMEKKITDKLSKKESYQLYIHLQTCKYCKIYFKKVHLIHNLFKKNNTESNANIENLDVFNAKIKNILKI